MTWKELAKKIQTELTEEQQDTDVTFFDANNGEFYPCRSLDINEFSDVLDEGHPFLQYL